MNVPDRKNAYNDTSLVNIIDEKWKDIPGYEEMYQVSCYAPFLFHFFKSAAHKNLFNANLRFSLLPELPCLVRQSFLIVYSLRLPEQVIEMITFTAASLVQSVKKGRYILEPIY